MEKIYAKSSPRPRAPAAWAAVPSSSSASPSITHSSYASSSTASTLSSRSEPQFYRATNLTVKKGANVAYTGQPELKARKSQELLKLRSKSSASSLREPPIPTVPSPSPAVSTLSSPAVLKMKKSSAKISSMGGESEERLKQAKTQVARLDRKVMDLEISNASLLAVNKYLEKRIRSSQDRIPQTDDARRLDFDSSVDDPDDESDDDDDDEADISHVSARELLLDEVGMDAAAIDDKAELIQDRVDGHIAFLERSQTIETSLLRCISLSDTMIKLANDSINYTIGPDEIKLGGKVVINDDDDDDDTNDF